MGPLDLVETLRRGFGKFQIWFAVFRALDLYHYASMSRSEATYIRLPVTTYGIPPEPKDNNHSFFENAKARRARRTLSFTILGVFISVFLVLGLGSLPGRLLFQSTANEVDPQGKGESGLVNANKLDCGVHLWRQKITQTFQSTLGCTHSLQMTSD